MPRQREVVAAYLASADITIPLTLMGLVNNNKLIFRNVSSQTIVILSDDCEKAKSQFSALMTKKLTFRAAYPRRQAWFQRRNAIKSPCVSYVFF